MSRYIPPFTVSPKAIRLIADIAAQIERYAIRMEQKDALLLRKANRIKTIHGSLAIEGNRLSEDMVAAIVNGRRVVAPEREIREVRNAVATYDIYETLNPFSQRDLLRAHGRMMEALAEDAGMYRRGGVGVFAAESLVHMAPPADRVPALMDDLFDWLKSSEDHLLIRSCVFHYEFEFIHPFSDGNGRMGRLWQSLILGRLHPLFAHLPVENMVFFNPQAYYDAIARSSDIGDCRPFIDYMLEEILETLKRKQGERSADVGTNVGINVGAKERTALEAIRRQPTITARQLAEQLNISQRQAERIFASLSEKGVIARVGAKKGGFWQIADR